MAAALNEVIAQAAAPDNLEVRPQQVAAGGSEPAVAACRCPAPAHFTGHPKLSGHPYPGTAKGSPRVLLGEGSCRSGAQATPFPASRVKDQLLWLRGSLMHHRNLSREVSALWDVCGAQALPGAVLGIGTEMPKAQGI